MSSSAKDGKSTEGWEVPGDSDWRGRPAIEYYDPEDENYHWCYADKNPVSDAFSYPDDAVYMLEMERDSIRSTNFELETEVEDLQAENKRLVGTVEQLQYENSELRVDRVRVGERLRKTTKDAEVMKVQIEHMKVYADAGMMRMREAYDSYEKIIMTNAVSMFPEDDFNENIQGRPIIFEEGEGSTMRPEESNQEMPVDVPGTSNWRQYAGWCYP